VLDCTFENDQSASVDHDVGGGAIDAGGLTEAVVSGSTSSGRSGSTGGGIPSRSPHLRVVDSVSYDERRTTYAASGQYGSGGGLSREWARRPSCVERTGRASRVHG
jgi:hypothetical protein